MSDQQLLERITLNPKVMVGKPVIKGTRLTVEYILNLLAHGATLAEILEEYADLTEAERAHRTRQGFEPRDYCDDERQHRTVQEFHGQRELQALDNGYCIWAHL